MKTPYYHVDAFTDRIFSGNPAGVCPLESWPADDLLQHIAAENSVPETAFFVRTGDRYRLRWFTPTVEIDLCGHATLAAGHIILTFLEPGAESVTFDSASGPLRVERVGDMLALDFPSRPPKPVEAPAILAEALGAAPREVLAARDLVAVFDHEDDVRLMAPDMEKLRKITDWFAVIVTAPGSTVDFVSRFFAPNAGIPEDPVTGSAHCELAPYWSARLGKQSLHARQLSARGGELFCEDRGDRVRLAGNAVLYSRGEISLP